MRTAKRERELFIRPRSSFVEKRKRGGEREPLFQGQRKLKATEFASLQDLWPRDGVLRVEIIKNVSDRYNITESYRKEYGDNMVLELLQVRIVLSPGAMLLIIREPWLPVSQT